MEPTATQNVDEPETKWCLKCNNFYGKREQLYLCSSCFKTSPEAIEQAKAEEEKKKAEEEAKRIEEEANKKPEQVKKNRCWFCNKKVGVLGFDCKCGYIFCATHRHFDDHQCDFKVDATEKLAKANPLIMAKQISKT